MTWTYEPREHLTHCNICHAPPSEWEHVADRDRAGFPARSVICRNCGLVFITPRMTAEGYAEFYGCGAYREIAKRFGHTTEKMERSQFWYAKNVGNWLEKVFPEAMDGASLLDIGGSNGIVAAAFKSRFGLSSATVLEPSMEECGQASQRGLICELGSFESWEPTCRYDFITLWQTADHLLDVSGSLAKVRSILSPTGYFAVDIVDVSHLLKHLPVEMCLKIDHPVSFTAHTMAHYLLRAGFSIVSWGTMLGGRKAFFLCRPDEPRDVLPDRGVIDGLRNQICEVRNANHGNRRHQPVSQANPA